MAKVDRADAYKQLPLKTEGEYAAVVPLRNTFAKEFYGFSLKNQPSETTAAGLRYNFL